MINYLSKLDNIGKVRFILLQILSITKQKIIASIAVEKEVQMTTLKIGQDMCNVSPVQGEI